MLNITVFSIKIYLKTKSLYYKSIYVESFEFFCIKNYSKSSKLFKKKNFYIEKIYI